MTGDCGCEADGCSEVDQATTAASSPRAGSEPALLQWLRTALSVTKDCAAADSLLICAEIILFDDSMPLQDRIESVSEALKGEGVADEVLVELAIHIADHVETSP
mmetsp:Transcript_42795/g.124414  ORF Transcript_42795/g.124414 Transcript_42795/m.124414 type:complete len:105 (-) Transcript_42795:259-573(-)